MKSSIKVNVSFLVGKDIADAIAEAKAKAEKWDVAYVCFDFNGVSFSISRNADIDSALEEWRRGNHKCGIVA